MFVGARPAVISSVCFRSSIFNEELTSLIDESIMFPSRYGRRLAGNFSWRYSSDKVPALRCDDITTYRDGRWSAVVGR